MTGIALSVNPGQSLRNLKPICGQTNDVQVLINIHLFVFVFVFYQIKNIVLYH